MTDRLITTEKQLNWGIWVLLPYILGVYCIFFHPSCFLPPPLFFNLKSFPQGFFWRAQRRKDFQKGFGNHFLFAWLFLSLSFSQFFFPSTFGKENQAFHLLPPRFLSFFSFFPSLYPFTFSIFPLHFFPPSPFLFSILIFFPTDFYSFPFPSPFPSLSFPSPFPFPIFPLFPFSFPIPSPFPTRFSSLSTNGEKNQAFHLCIYVGIR